MITALLNGGLKYVVAAMATMLLAFAGYNFYLRNTNAGLVTTVAAHTATIQTQSTELKAGAAREVRSAATLKQYQAANAALAKKEKLANDKLDTALASNRDWSDAPVPVAITDWLRDNQDPDGNGKREPPRIPDSGLPRPREPSHQER